MGRRMSRRKFLEKSQRLPDRVVQNLFQVYANDVHYVLLLTVLTLQEHKHRYPTKNLVKVAAIQRFSLVSSLVTSNQTYHSQKNE